ncbi:MAG TPA: patatin-like phospholipase family protein, partial [Thermoanaerobaculia bacterium]
SPDTRVGPETEATERPTISLLFSGGVFRGVFYMGVANALVEVGCVPDLVAGASVGSITAAMVARLFLAPAKERPSRIADLISTFLAIDRLIRTDRFTDFVRLLTLRAADTNFSPRDLDLTLRRFDYDRSTRFNDRLRRVAAGIERLLWVSPFELYALVEAQRLQRSARLSTLLREYLQEYLVRCGVEHEILGSEPLSLLIKHLVLQPGTRGAGPVNDHFSMFVRDGIYFLATTTNLTEGKLEILGDPRVPDDPSLTEALLASSAFPAIFRPRRSTAVYASNCDSNQLIDGGVMDNLPFDSVTGFLDRAATRMLIARRPMRNGERVPHLLFTASLETDFEHLTEAQATVVAGNWIRLMQRAKQLQYNRKVDLYSKLQSDLRAIDEWRSRRSAAPSDRWRPLDLHILTVKPKWLCSTFAFHPMLGFRREKQAANIAHGCASTFASLRASSLKNEAWVRGWMMNDAVAKVRDDAVSPELMPRRDTKIAGQCWFRNDARCPFSKEAMEMNDISDPSRIRELSKIYELCGRPETHRSVMRSPRVIS